MTWKKVNRYFWLIVIVMFFKLVYFNNSEDAMQIQTDSNLSAKSFIGDKVSEFLIYQIIEMFHVSYWFTEDNKNSTF